MAQLGALLILSGCSVREAESPASPIPQDDLVAIIAEALILEPAVKEVPYVFQDSVHRVYYERILTQRGYTPEAFAAAMKALQADPHKMTKYYEQALEYMEKIDANAQGKD